MPTVIAPPPRLRLHPWWPVVGHVISQALLGLFVFEAASMALRRLLGGPLSAGAEDALMVAVEVLVLIGCCAQAARRDASIDQVWVLQLVVASLVFVGVGWWGLAAWSGMAFDLSADQRLLDGAGLALLVACASAGVRLGQALRPRGMQA